MLKDAVGKIVAAIAPKRPPARYARDDPFHNDATRRREVNARGRGGRWLTRRGWLGRRRDEWL